eukprot:2982723-Amphidinium_carterae.1
MNCGGMVIYSLKDSKRKPFASLFASLGVQFEIGLDKVCILRTEGRKIEIKAQLPPKLTGIRQRGAITSKEALALRGRVQFLETQIIEIWARAGSLCLDGLDK